MAAKKARILTKNEWKVVTHGQSTLVEITKCTEPTDQKDVQVNVHLKRNGKKTVVSAKIDIEKGKGKPQIKIGGAGEVCEVEKVSIGYEEEE